MVGRIWCGVRTLVECRRRTILAAFLLLHHPVGLATGGEALVCSKLNPTPNALEGAVTSQNYTFIYASYYERDPPNDDFVTVDALIENKSPDRVLPIRWPNAGISFDRLNVNSDVRFKCISGRHDLIAEKMQLVAEGNSPLEYGPILQEHKDASAYVLQPVKPVTSQSNNSQGATGQGNGGQRRRLHGTSKRRLNSCVAAEIIEKSQNKTVHLEFTSSFEGKYFRCDVKNLGTDPVLFRLPAFGKGEFLKNIQEVKSNWPTSETDKSLYRVENGRTYSLAAMTVIETFTTDEVEVAVASEERPEAPLLTSLVSVYVPLD